MYLASLRHSSRLASALVLASLFAVVPARAQQPQPTARDSSKSKMPMNMQMGTSTKKKKPASSAKSTSSTPGKKKSSAKSVATTRSSAKKLSPTMAMRMPSKSAPKRKSASMAGMQMGAHPPATHGDTAQAKMRAMDMQRMPEAKDSAHMNMRNMPSKPDSAHMDTPGMAGMPGMAGDKRDSSASAMKGMQQGMNMPGMQGHTTGDMMIGPAGVSMERMGSGTTWIPDAVSMPSRTRMVGNWMIMAHGFVFAQYDKQSGERGADQFGSLNWAMLMATHDLAGGRFQARTMLSLDPLTVTNRGYPLLLQTGESYKGQPLFDRQHPHDFWMELGALYQRPITKSLAWSLYAAPSGEPALGPVAFMHRPSAMDIPNAPIGHHWQDATHVSFGVFTTGIFTHTWQLEGSVFNGREPDERRWDFDPIHLDSYSGRFTLNPNAHWSLGGAYGYLKSPEGLNPTESMHRVTTSAQHGTSLGSDGQIASTLIWAANKHSTMPGLSNSFLLESEAILDRKNTLFGRTELVQKNAEELVVVNPVTTSKGVLLPGFPAAQHFNVRTAQLGYIRELARTHWATVGLGAAGTLNFVPGPLEPYYGSRTPVGTFIFLRLRPFHVSKKGMNDMGGMKMGSGHE
jgi:hypothetical protein